MTHFTQYYQNKIVHNAIIGFDTVSLVTVVRYISTAVNSDI